MPEGLTAKQEHFAQLVAAGSTQIGAQRQAYDRNDETSNGDYVDASQLAALPKVNLRIAQLTHEAAAVAAITQGYVLNGVKSVTEAAAKAEAHSPALKGYELLGKHLGMFVDRVEIDQHIEIDVSADELRAVLADIQSQRASLPTHAEEIEGDAESD